jgi:trehalose 6-phosphate phosphatase
MTSLREIKHKGSTNSSKLESHSRLRSFLHDVARANQMALLLDYDGTLAPFRTNRSEAYPYPGVVGLLRKLMDHTKTRLIIVSGRDGRDVRGFLDLDPAPEIWGIHGAQRIKADGTVEMYHGDGQTEEALQEALRDAEHWLEYQQLLHTAEFKPGSIAVHWRGLPEETIEDIHARVLLGWRVIAKYNCLSLLEFDGGVEILAGRRNKGDAVRVILNELDDQTPVAYLGDDLTDESAFEAIRGRGLSVLVRIDYRSTAAEVWLSPPFEMIEFLEAWLKASARNGRNNNGSVSPAVNY